MAKWLIGASALLFIAAVAACGGNESKPSGGTTQPTVAGTAIPPNASAPAMELSLSSLQVLYGSFNVSSTGTASLRTPPLKYNYATQLALPRPDGYTDTYVRVRATVKGGAIGIGIETKDKSDFIDRASIAEADGTKEVLLHVPRLADAGVLVFQTWMDDQAAEVEVLSIALVRSQ